jgi:hypothetical protein
LAFPELSSVPFETLFPQQILNEWTVNLAVASPEEEKMAPSINAALPQHSKPSTENKHPVLAADEVGRKSPEQKKETRSTRKRKPRGGTFPGKAPGKTMDSAGEAGTKKKSTDLTADDSMDNIYAELDHSSSEQAEPSSSDYEPSASTSDFVPRGKKRARRGRSSKPRRSGNKYTDQPATEADRAYLAKILKAYNPPEEDKLRYQVRVGQIIFMIPFLPSR